MFSSHAGAETYTTLKHGRIIHRRDPEATTAQLVAHTIPALAIADDDRHHICCGGTGIEAQALKLRVEIIGVLPKTRAEFRLTRAKLKRLENGRDDDRG